MVRRTLQVLCAKNAITMRIREGTGLSSEKELFIPNAALLSLGRVNSLLKVTHVQRIFSIKHFCSAVHLSLL